MRPRPLLPLILSALMLSLQLSAHCGPGSLALADALTVTKTEDTNDGVCDADCSLREAIVAANVRPGADTITVPAGTYSLTRTGGDDSIDVGDLDITEALTLRGQGFGATIVDSNGLDRGFEIHPGASEVTLAQVSIINGNTSVNGGGIACRDTALLLEGVILDGNATTARGGGLWAENCTITMSTTILMNNTASDQGGGMYVSGGTITLEGSGVVSNETSDQGGGIYTYLSALTLNQTAVGSNISTGSGAGIFVNSAVVNVNQSSLVANSTGHSGGGLFMNLASSVLTMTDSLVALNEADVEGGGLFLVDGAGATIQNSTISGNIATTYGGGVNTRIPLTITHSTIANNTADAAGHGAGHGGGVFAYLPSAVVQLSHTILADNVDGSDPAYADCYRWATGGEVNSDGYNLVETVGNCTFAAAGDITGQDPRLGLLRDNGGATLTHAVASQSPAHDAGDPAFAPPPDWDQRGEGFPRVIGGIIDIGAYEVWVPVWLPIGRR